MNNINAYNITECQNYCNQLPFFNQLVQDFDILRWNKAWEIAPNGTTSRETFGSKNKTVFSMVPFFYLKVLLEQNPKVIYDLGSGWNIFKKYIPNIIGISPTHNIDHYSDVHDLVDQEFVQGHQNYFRSVFSINALHFRPLTDLENIIQEFASIVSPGGQGFLALNLARLVDHTPNNILIDTFKTGNPTTEQYEIYTREVLDTTKLNYQIVDVDFTVVDEYMDGNIRIVFRK
jgi:hypothetical protein